MKLTSFGQWLSLLALMTLSTLTWAGAGHDHDHGDKSAATTSKNIPRWAAVSETFEMVGVLNGTQMILYVDRLETNEPVKDADIELDINGQKYKAKSLDDGNYEVSFPARPEAGIISITATLTVGKEADLLAGELDIHEDDHIDSVSSLKYKWAALVALILAAAALFLFKLKKSRIPQHSSRGAA